MRCRDCFRSLCNSRALRHIPAVLHRWSNNLRSHHLATAEERSVNWSLPSEQTIAPNNGTDFKPLFCLGDAFAAKGIDVGLDALGAIPGLGNLVSGSVAGAKVIKTISGAVSLATVRQGGRAVDGVLAYGGGFYSANSAAGEENALGSLVGAGSAGAGIGLALAGQTLGEGARAIPVAGNIISGATGLWDIYQGIKAYKSCMASSKYN